MKPILFFLTSVLCSLTSVFGQTGTIHIDQDMTGHKLLNVGTPTLNGDAANKLYVDTHGGGGGGSGTVTSITATAPIIVTPGPLTTTGVISLDSTSKSNWDTAFTQTRQWDGGATGLVAATGRTSLGLVIGTNVAPATSGSSILYGNGSGGFSSVTVGSGLSFTTGTLTATGSGGNLSTTGSPLDNQVAVFTDATHVEGNSNLSFDSSTNILSSVIMSPTTGFRINGAAANRRILVGNATNFVQSTETYAVPGSSGNVMQSDGTNWTSAADTFSNLSGNWTLAQGPSTTASRLLGRTSASAGIPQEITLGTNLAMSGTTLNATGGGGGAVGGSITYTGDAPYTILSTDKVVATNAAFTTARTWTLPTAAAVGAGNAIAVIDMQGTLTTTNTLTIARASSDLIYPPGASTYIMSSVSQGVTFISDGVSKWYAFTIQPGGNLTGLFAQQSWTGGVYAASLYKLPTSIGSIGKMLQSDGSNVVFSTPTWPTSTVGSGRIIRSNGTNFAESTAGYPDVATGTGTILQANGTNWVASTPTWPTAAGTAGYSMRSDGTNVASYPQDMLNSSTASDTSFSNADRYLIGSNITVAAGDFKAKGQYRCVFDMTKSAGTGAITISVRAGTAGSTSDTAQLVFNTFPAGTSVADAGTFEVIVTWRSVGSGTSAVLQGVCRAQKNTITAAGLWGDTSAAKTIVATTSSGFASNTFTNIGLSFNGNTAFTGTVTLVQASLLQ